MQKLTPEDQQEYEALVASCKYHPPPPKDGWLVNALGIVLLVFVIMAGTSLLEKLMG